MGSRILKYHISEDSFKKLELLKQVYQKKQYSGILDLAVDFLFDSYMGKTEKNKKDIPNNEQSNKKQNKVNEKQKQSVSTVARTTEINADKEV